MAYKAVLAHLRQASCFLAGLSATLCIMVALGAVSPAVQAQGTPYGDCSYSDVAVTYGGNDNCQVNTQPDPAANQTGSLADTGQNYLRLLYAALGLIVFSGGAGAALYIITKKRSRSTV